MSTNYIDCNNQGVQVHIEQSDQTLFKKPLDFNKLNSASFVDPINPQKTMKQGSPVLTIKLNYCSDGMVIGYSWHYSIGDMSSFMAFLGAVSAFAKTPPYLFSPVGQAPFPWVSCIVEGLENQGLLATIALPTKIAKRLNHSSMLKKIHTYL